MTATPRRLTLAALAAAVLAPLPAAAQSQLDRMETLSERANVLIYDAMIAEMPALEGNMPDAEWDETLRTAYACLLDGYVDASSEAAVDQMLDEMEAAMADATADTIMSGEMGQGVQLPEGVDQAQSQALMSNCGVVEAMMARMAESGAMEIMMQQ